MSDWLAGWLADWLAGWMNDSVDEGWAVDVCGRDACVRARAHARVAAVANTANQTKPNQHNTTTARIIAFPSARQSDENINMPLCFVQAVVWWTRARARVRACVHACVCVCVGG